MRQTEPYRAVATPTPIVALRGRARCLVTARTHEDPFIYASRRLHEESRYGLLDRSLVALAARKSPTAAPPTNPTPEAMIGPSSRPPASTTLSTLRPKPGAGVVPVRSRAPGTK